MNENVVPERPAPLAGVTVLELGGIGPGPFACMVLADLGATVVRLERDGSWGRHPVLHRGRTMLQVDLKDPASVRAVQEIAARADVVVEGFRPGAAERLGLGPDAVREVNPGVIYGRMTGWGQEGPWASAPGHDINYLGLTGALHAIGAKDGDPVVPLNLVADFGGGGMLLALGVVAALAERERTGTGRVVDAAMVDGASLLMAMTWSHFAMGRWTDERGSNILDGAAPFYRTYRTVDGKHMAVGCAEPQFYAEFLRLMGLDGEPLFDDQLDEKRWQAQAHRIADVFATKSRQEWERLFEGSQACTTPVLSLAEVVGHPQVASRMTMVQRDQVLQPAPAPLFDGRRPQLPPVAAGSPAAMVAALADFGISEEQVGTWIDGGVVKATG